MDMRIPTKPLFCAIGLAFTFIAFGAFQNYWGFAGTKYISSAELSVDDTSCSSTWINILREGTTSECCNPSSKGHGFPLALLPSLCWYASWGIVKVLTQLWAALLLPLLPIMLSMSSTMISINMAKAETEKRCFAQRQACQKRRLGMYLLIIMVRTFVLYLLWDMVERQFFAASDSCWYEAKRGTKGCKDRFDSADHVVLFLVQYLSILAVEATATAHEMADQRLVQLLSWSYTVVLGGASLLAIFGTAAYFHSVPETVVAVVFSLVVWLPLYTILSGAKVPDYLHVSCFIHLQNMKVAESPVVRACKNL
uniref:Uncharacterized protein n=1 Tax=Fibrocapsa japonica TaxID=94617 RepID=A0A7S2V6Y4_9STRA